MVLAINDRCAPDTKKTDILILLVVTTYDTFTTIFNINNNKIYTPPTPRNNGLSGISGKASSKGSIKFEILRAQEGYLAGDLCPYLT